MGVFKGLFFLICLPVAAQIVIGPPALAPGILASSYPAAAQPNGTLGFAPFAFQAGAGTAPFIWGLASGSLPPGLTLQPNGRLLGIPAAQGSFTFSVRVADARGLTATREYTLAVGPRHTVQTGGRAGSSYVWNRSCFSASGPAFTFLVFNGSLPPGIQMNPQNGILSGIPTREGVFRYFWQCASTAFTLTMEDTFTVGPPPQFTLRNGVVGQPYDRPIVFDDTFPKPIQGTVVEGSLPPGLNLANPLAPAVSGAPAAPGLFLFSVRWTAANGTVNTRRYVLYIANTPTIQLLVSRVDLAGQSDGAVEEHRVGVQTNSPGLRFTTGVATENGGEWLKAAPVQNALPSAIDLDADPTGLAPGEYRGAVTVSGDPPAEAQTLKVNFTVAPGPPPRPAVDHRWIGLHAFAGGGSSTRHVRLINRGSGSYNFRASVETKDGRNWLSLSPTEGTVTAKRPLTAVVSANPADLSPGVYNGRITLEAADIGSAEILVTFAVGPSGGHLHLSQTGLSFRTSTLSNEHDLWIGNNGAGTLNWEAAAATTAGDWLKLSATSGRSTAASAGSRTLVSVDPTGLAPGVYHGRVRVTSPEALNSPQIVLVRMAVASPEQLLLSVQPVGLVFDSTGQSDILLHNLGAEVTFTAHAIFPTGDEWFRVEPGSGALDPGGSRRLSVSASTADLKPGFYPARLIVRWGDTPEASSEIQMLLIAPRPAAAAIPSKSLAAAGCAPSQLVPLFTNLAPNFRGAVGWPMPLELQVIDDCGQRLTAGNVTLSFSNGDPALSMRSQNDGRWAATWSPRRASDNLTITVRAAWPEQKLEATVKVAGSLAEQSGDIPWIRDDGVVSSVTLEPQTALAPGSLVSVLGDSLAGGDAVAESTPFPAELSGARLLIAGREVPLSQAGAKKIEGVVPFDLPVNLAQQVIVLRDQQISVPETVTLASAQPAIFTVDGAGGGQGQIEWVREDGTRTLANAEAPARAGATLILTAAGLGPTNPAISAGDAPADSSLAAVYPVKVRFGDRSVDAAGAFLAPAKPGVYEVTVKVPEGLTPGTVAVSLLVEGQVSPAVSMSVQ